MATKVKADLIFEYNLLPVYYDNGAVDNNELSTFNYGELMEILSSKNNNEFTTQLVSLDLSLSRISIFSHALPSQNPTVKTWEFSEFTNLEQVTINNFINTL